MDWVGITLAVLAVGAGAYALFRRVKQDRLEAEMRRAAREERLKRIAERRKQREARKNKQ